jgi:hypothetical protein
VRKADVAPVLLFFLFAVCFFAECLSLQVRAVVVDDNEEKKKEERKKREKRE